MMMEVNVNFEGVACVAEDAVGVRTEVETGRKTQ